MKTRACLLIGCLGLGLASNCLTLGQIIAYSDFAPSDWVTAYPTASAQSAPRTVMDEFGDEIVLADNTPRTVSSFAFQYLHQNLTGNERVEVRFYHNDGVLFQGFPTPNTLIYDSGPLPLTANASQSVMTLNNLNVTVPDSFTWTVQFTGLTGNSVAALAVNGPQKVGLSYDDFWEKAGGNWGLYTFSNPAQPGSFGAEISVVPEPSATPFVLLGTAVLGVAGIRKMRTSTR